MIREVIFLIALSFPHVVVLFFKSELLSQKSITGIHMTSEVDTHVKPFSYLGDACKWGQIDVRSILHALHVTTAHKSG